MPETNRSATGADESEALTGNWSVTGPPWTILIKTLGEKVMEREMERKMSVYQSYRQSLIYFILQHISVNKSTKTKTDVEIEARALTALSDISSFLQAHRLLPSRPFFTAGLL